MFLRIYRLSVCSLVAAVSAARGQSRDLKVSPRAAATGTAVFVKTDTTTAPRFGRVFTEPMGLTSSTIRLTTRPM